MPDSLGSTRGRRPFCLENRRVVRQGGFTPLTIQLDLQLISRRFPVRGFLPPTIAASSRISRCILKGFDRPLDL